MNEFQYTLEPYSGQKTRHRCPKCNAPEKTFVRYIDRATGGYIHPDVGRCNRESNCGYHYKPKQYFLDNNIDRDSALHQKANLQPKSIPEKLPSYIAHKILNASLKKQEDNHFIHYLDNLFGHKTASELIGKYYIGTSKHWEGSTVFWQIDSSGRIRSGKVMLYDPVTGKRVKEPFSYITWVHKILKQQDFVLKQCFYGEHLLKDKTKPVAIVESEKTAIIASAYLQQFTWLAVGSLNNLNLEICEALLGRFVVLFPDLKGFEKWSDKAKQFSAIATFSVSDLLERKATEEEKKKGLDLADYLIRYDYKDFALPESDPSSGQEPKLAIAPPSFPDNPKTYGQYDISLLIEFKNKDHAEEVMTKPWDQEIKELENRIDRVLVPESPIRLNSYSLIEDPAKFIHSHLDIIKANNGNSTYLPYLKRLQEIMQLYSKSLN
ncbi:MAG: hypothetical protein KBC43_05725 [Bacteroidales bacterium]|nr:hypothetical protein [Bacteroidales bacterium]